GVVGGALTALLATENINKVWEYPLDQVQVGQARPWDRRRMRGEEIGALAAIAVLAGGVAALSWWMTADPEAWAALWRVLPLFPLQTLCMVILGPAIVCAFLLRDRAQAFTAALLMIGLSAQYVTRGYDYAYSERSFFGVMRVANQQDPGLGGDVHVLTHGTTWHGSQARDPRHDCQPTLYYHPLTPIGQSAEIIQARGPARIGVVGQGAGTMAAYKRAEDTLTFFEIDPMVDRMSRDPKWFTYISDCAVGEVRTVLGDARLTLEDQPAGTYDLLIIDAFSSDAVPTHLLTVEAIEGYLRLLKPEGVVLLHLSNRNLEIVLPTIAAAKALGRPALHGLYVEDDSLPMMAIASTEAVVISPTGRGLADFRGKPNWSEVPETSVRPWTDDYVNLFGALWRSFRPPPERP
ncbi:MAG: fused MFS/spermidine synthase, partial [Brevundimonas sp.]|nr:fused MFS/spermidine synthase [Brevundimonas sp.]